MKTIIYSTKKIKGIDGVYASPSLFNGDTENCDIVYTNEAKIRESYEAKGIKVVPIVKPKPMAVKAK